MCVPLKVFVCCQFSKIYFANNKHTLQHLQRENKKIWRKCHKLAQPSSATEEAIKVKYVFLRTDYNQKIKYKEESFLQREGIIKAIKEYFTFFSRIFPYFKFTV